MPSRRRKVASTHKATAQADSISVETSNEESRPVVTQVVEVVEEVTEPPMSEVPSPQPEEQKETETEMTAPTEEELAEEVPQTPAEKTKAMVEELYTGRKEPRVMPEISMHQNKSAKPLVVWAIVTIMVALVTGGVLFTVTKKSFQLPAVFVKPTPTPTPAPTPTPTPTPIAVDKTSFEVQVLNGGGTAGAATKMKQFLEDKGYKVGATGNTEEFTYDKTEIHGKSAMQTEILALEADLKDTYTIGTVAADLASNASYDVRVIVGK